MHTGKPILKLESSEHQWHHNKSKKTSQRVEEDTWNTY